MRRDPLLLSLATHDEVHVRQDLVVEHEGQALLHGHLGRLPVVHAQLLAHVVAVEREQGRVLLLLLLELLLLVAGDRRAGHLDDGGVECS